MTRDAENDLLSVGALGPAAHGNMTLNADQSVTYTPDTGFANTDTFTYTVTDSHSNSTATVSVTVGTPNRAPTAVGDSRTTPEDTPVTIAVLADDSDPDGDPLTVSAVTQGEHGLVSTDGRTVVYRSDLNFNGTDAFTYTLSDGDLSNSANVTITVTSVNDPPTAVDDQVTTERNTSVTFNALANDSDLDGDSINVSAVGTAGHGTVILQANQPLPVPERKITYVPDAGFHGTDVFSYTITDGELTDTTQVTVTVTVQLPLCAHSANADVNGDGVMGVQDVQMIAAGWRSPGSVPHYDVDGDGAVTVADVMCVIAAWEYATP